MSDYFDRTVCPPPCGTMHSYVDDERMEACAHEDDLSTAVSTEVITGDAPDMFSTREQELQSRLDAVRELAVFWGSLEGDGKHFSTNFYKAISGEILAAIDGTNEQESNE